MTDSDDRPDPDALLAEMQRIERAAQPGRLFIFLGMSPGVGKTYAMLEAARQRQREGLKVLVAVVETHGRSETAALLEGLDVLARRRLGHQGVTLEEMDVDEVLRRRPDLVIVDELAHSNAPGSRHAKRYQDVLELLDAGLDVFTTLNVQHIESQVDIVRQISGITVRERVPDSILDIAHEIQLIDLSAEKLLSRLAEGRVYLGERAEQAASNFFRESTLIALRELALRFTAERVDRDLEDIRRARRVSSPWKTNARLLVGIGPSPFAESLIRWTRRAAARLDCPWIVAWVEASAPLGVSQQDTLNRALALARRLGAEVVSLTGDDVATALLDFARERNVSQIIVGKPGTRGHRRTLTDRIIEGSGDIDICIVRPTQAGPVKPVSKGRRSPAGSGATAADYLKAAAVTLGVTLAFWLLLPFTGYVFGALMLLLTVLVAGLRFPRGPVMLMATLAALGWDFFFIPPQYTFYIQKPEDAVLFGLFFIVASAMGHLTTRLRQRETAERRRQRETAALLRVTQSAALAAEPEKGLAEALRLIGEVLCADVALFVRRDDRTLPAAAHPASDFTPDEKEHGVLTWVYDHKQAAGRFTDTLPQSTATWFPLQTATATMGVLGIRLAKGALLNFTTRQTMEAFALQLALVLEKEHFIRAVSGAEIVDQSEKLRRTLLDSVTHELVTPIAIIQAALEGHAAANDPVPKDPCLVEILGRLDATVEVPAPPPDPYLAEIRTATDRLQRVVDHLLSMTRLESSVLQPAPDWCDLHDVIDSARAAAGDGFSSRGFAPDLPPGLPLLRLDANLLAQALANVLHNAAVYTPPGTRVDLRARLVRLDRLRLVVRDHGAGLPPGDEARVFEKFFRAPGSPAGGTGLGLAIARGLLRALGGDLTARNHPEGGAEFTLELPVEVDDGSLTPNPASSHDRPHH